MAAWPAAAWPRGPTAEAAATDIAYERATPGALVRGGEQACGERAEGMTQLSLRADDRRGYRRAKGAPVTAVIQR